MFLPFWVLTNQKNLFFLCVSAFSKWLLTSFFVKARYWPGHRDKMMPSSEKPRSKGKRKTSPQTKWFEVYNAKCHTHGDPSATSPLFLFSPAFLWSATCNVAECHKYLNSSLLLTSVPADHFDKIFAKCLAFLGQKWFLKSLTSRQWSLRVTFSQWVSLTYFLASYLF